MDFLSGMGLIVYFVVLVFTFLNLGSRRMPAVKSFILAVFWPLSMIFMFIFMVGVFINTKRVDRRS